MFKKKYFSAMKISNVGETLTQSRLEIQIIAEVARLFPDCRLSTHPFFQPGLLCISYCLIWHSAEESTCADWVALIRLIFCSESWLWKIFPEAINSSNGEKLCNHFRLSLSLSPSLLHSPDKPIKNRKKNIYG